eukprot:scaffold133482_cov93-Phaeocystis_antarctica.AAC.1
MSHDKDQQLLSRRALHSLLAVNFFIETNRMEYATSQGSNLDTRLRGFCTHTFEPRLGQAADRCLPDHLSKLAGGVGRLREPRDERCHARSADARRRLHRQDSTQATHHSPCHSHRKVGATVALTETSNKIGSVLFTIVAGLVSYFTYPDVSSVFYVLGGGGVVASVFVLLIPPATVDDDRARQLDTKKEAKGEASPNEAAKKVSASNYRELFRNRNIVIFAVLTFLYHLSNAGIVPLVSQLIAQQDERASLAFTSAVLCINYFVQAPTAYIVGLTYHRFGYKKILLVGHLVLPIRCTVLALCARFVPNRYALVSTQ